MKQIKSDQQLDDRLIAEAADQSPVFSPDLHERIMNRITAAPTAKLQKPIRNWFIMPAAIAAVVLLAAGLVFYLNHPAPPHAMVAKLPSMPAIQNPLVVLEQPAVTQWATARYAYLDRDGEKLLGYMSRQLDVIPQQR
jgi:hypothetical protein